MTPYERIASMKDLRAVKHDARPDVKGKDYIVEDGDILNIRFSV